MTFTEYHRARNKQEYRDGPQYATTVIQSWLKIGKLQIGSAYLNESISESFAIQIGAEGGLNYGAVLTINKATTSTYSATLSTPEGSRAKVTYYQLIETIYIKENGVIVKTVVNHVESFGRVIEGWKWEE